MRANFVFSEVVTGLRRNLTMTIAMIITTAISLALLGAGMLLAFQVNKMKDLYFDNVEVSIYLRDDITNEQRTVIEQQLDDSPEVREFEYLDKPRTFERFQRIFADQPDFVEAVGPEDLPASYQVGLHNAERNGVIKSEFENVAGVDQVNSQGELLDKIFGLFNGIRNATVALALVQALAALLLISNTIQVAAFTRRTETGIMRLVGASRWYTQLPFLLEAAVAGLVGAALAVGGLFAAKKLFVDSALRAPIESRILPPIEWSTILAISPVLAAVGVLLASIAAYVTLRLYVRL